MLEAEDNGNNTAATNSTRRKLTDADIIALADEMENRIVQRFYTNLGKGIVGLVWKTIIIAALSIAAYGAGKGWKFTP